MIFLPNALSALKRLHQKYLPNVPFEAQFVDESFALLYKKESEINHLFQYFAGIALFLACLGLFGLSTYSCETRSKEIGIRKILGASIKSIVQLLGKEFLVLLSASIVIALPIAWYIMKSWLDNFAYSVQLSWWIFVIGGITLITIAMLTVSIQAIKAALVNPVARLRNE